MQEIKLEKAFLELYKPKQRTVGKYYVSDLWAMTSGYLPPEKFLALEPFNLGSQINCHMGIEKHESVQKLLQVIYPKGVAEERVEKKFGDFVIVGKADFIENDVIIEIKTSFDLMPDSKPWQDYQLKWYLELFRKERGYVVQPVFKTYNGKPVDMRLKILKIVYCNPLFVDKELDKIKMYHQALCEIVDKNNKK
jgi:hypothetical protein